MKKITGFTIGLMAAGFMQMGHAAATDVDKVYTAAPASATITVTFSGACKGKLELPVTSLVTETGFSEETGVVFQGTNYVNMYAYTGADNNDSVYFTAYNSTAYATDKFTQSLKKEVLKWSSTAKTDVYVNLPSNATSPTYSAITCKVGTLAQALTYKDTNGDNVVSNVYLNGQASKPSSVLSHQNAVVATPAAADPATTVNVPGTYKLSGTVSGSLYQPSVCTTKADAKVTDPEYSLTCKQPAAIKVKVQIKGKGDDNTTITGPVLVP